MSVRFHPHALERLSERGATEGDVGATVESGEQFAARFGRTRFRKSFPYDSTWQGRFYAMKEIEAIAVQQGEDWLVITVLTRYY